MHSETTLLMYWFVSVKSLAHHWKYPHDSDRTFTYHHPHPLIMMSTYPTVRISIPSIMLYLSHYQNLYFIPHARICPFNYAVSTYPLSESPQSCCMYHCQNLSFILHAMSTYPTLIFFPFLILLSTYPAVRIPIHQSCYEYVSYSQNPSFIPHAMSTYPTMRIHIPSIML